MSKRCVLQASVGDRTERFEATCDRVERLWERQFVFTRRTSETEQEDTICLQKDVGGSAACLVTLTPPKEDSIFPTVYLKPHEFRRLTQMEEVKVVLLEVSHSGKEEFGEGGDVRKDGGAEHGTVGVKDETWNVATERVKKALSRDGKYDRESHVGYKDTTSCLENTKNTNVVGFDKTSIRQGDSNVDEETEKAGTPESCDQVRASSCDYANPPSSGDESAVLLRTEERTESPTDSSHGFVDASEFSPESPKDGKSLGTKFNFGIESGITDVDISHIQLDRDGFPVSNIHAGDKAIEVSTPQTATQRDKDFPTLPKPSYADMVRAPKDEGGASHDNTQGGQSFKRDIPCEIPGYTYMSPAESSRPSEHSKWSPCDLGLHPLADDDEIMGLFEETEEEAPGLFGRAWNRLVGGKDTPKKKKAMMQPPNTWKQYGDLVHTIEAHRKNNNMMKKFYANVELILAPKEVSMPSLTLAAYVFNLNCGDKTEKLRSLILRHIAKISPSSEQIGLATVKTTFEPPSLRPNVVWSDFFTDLVKCESFSHFQNEDDALILKMFWIWDECGIFRRMHDPELWHSIRTSLAAAFPSGQYSRLKELLDVEKANSIGILLHGDFNSIAEFVLQSQDDKSNVPFRVHRHVSFHLVDLVAKAYRVDVTPYASFDQLWEGLFLSLSLVQFPTRSVLQNVLEGSVNAMSFRSSNTFHHYNDFVTSGVTNDKYGTIIRSLIRDSLCEDLLSAEKTPGVEDVGRLLTSPAGEYLDVFRGVAALKDFSKRAMRLSIPFDSKLRFVGDVFDFFVSRGLVARSQGERKHVLESIGEAQKSVSPLEQLQVAFYIAVNNPRVFCCDGGKVFLERVSKQLCNRISCRAVLDKPEILRELIIEEADSDVMSLMKCLTREMQDVLALECVDPGTASRFFLAIFAGETPPCSRLMNLAVHIFTNSVSKWDPADIVDLISLPAPTLQCVGDCFRVPNHTKCMPSADVQTMNDCRDRIIDIITKWSSDYLNEAFTRTDLERVCHKEDEGQWVLLSVIAGIELPSFLQMRVTCEDAAELERIIVRLLQGSEEGASVPLQSVIYGYSCFVEHESAIRRLLTGYDWLLAPEGSESKNTREIRHMRHDAAKGKEFCEKNSEPLAVCDYFLKNTCILFPSLLLDDTNASLSLESLVLAVQDAMSTIRNLIGPGSDFAKIRHAVNTILAGGSTIEHDMSVLMGCSQLQLSATDVDKFLLVAALANIIDPLQRFIECCHQFQFSVISDMKFERLASIVDEKSDDSFQSLSMGDCIKHSEQLCGIMTGRDNLQDANPDDICRAFERHLPSLKLLGWFSSHSEVWTFVREMNWFGKEGLKQFNEQYANVTNVLLGVAASYEMSVLDAVEPTVRAISAVDGFRQESEVASLLNSLQAHHGIASFVNDVGTSDIALVQSNLSQIRDWFTIGIDEIASVHATFDAVKLTGEYCLEQCQVNRKSSNLSANESDNDDIVFTLRYKAKGTSCVLQREDLNNFVQSIGLIQHDRESHSQQEGASAGSVDAFVEQHQILSRTARNILYMESIGFEESGKNTFSCMVGCQYVDEARELYQRSEVLLRKCRSWLSLIRSSHYVSLLFWTDELLEIHRMITKAIGANDEERYAIEYNLASVVSRLAVGNVSHRQLQSAVAAAIHSREETSFRQEASWLVDASTFLDSIHEALKAPWRAALDGNKSNSQIVLHTLACSRNEFFHLMLRVMQNIYKDRLPESFEIFDGLVDCTVDKLSVFLERVQTFCSSTFVILNIELLEGKLLETILTFLSNPTIGEKIRLHLIQRDGSMLHTAPWIHGERWESDEHHDGNGDRESEWRTLILGETHLNQVSVVWSRRSASGKSSYIENARRGSGAESAKITIHERASIKSLTEALLAKISQNAEVKVMHLNLTCLFDADEDENVNRTACLNRFFFSLLVLRSVRGSDSSQTFQLGDCSWRVYLEFPNNGGDSTIDFVQRWLRKHAPILLLCGTLVTPPAHFHVDEETRRVCTYLRAYDNGTIDRKFEGSRQKRIVLVLDKSGSMAIPMGAVSALHVAVDNALRIFDSHIGVDDEFGVVLFNHEVGISIPIQAIADDNHRQQLRQVLNQIRHHADGGTSMFGALRGAFASIAGADARLETWVVCLTDGASADREDLLRPYLENSRDNVHLIIVGVNLCSRIETHMHHLCSKYGRLQQEPCKGFFVHSDANMLSMNSAFDTVSRSIPVSQTFELDGAVTDEQCRFYLDKYAPSFVNRDDMLLMTFWIQFIYRRVKVFDGNESFNYNEKYESLGSTLMKLMLAEVECLLSENQSRDWIGRDHTQLIYDFTCKDKPAFRLLCTAPELLDSNTRNALEELDLPGFTVPTSRDLKQRSTLDLFLSQALNLPLQGGRLACIDENRFILTLDFTMKLLNIHERIACRIPCIIEGETGVSKTALTRMYTILRNTGIEEQAKCLVELDLEAIAQELVAQGHHVPFGFVHRERLEQALAEASELVLGNETDFARDLHKAILRKSDARPSMFREIPPDFTHADEARTTAVGELLSWFCAGSLEPTFFDVNVDSSLTEHDFVEKFVPIRKAAQKLQGSEALVVVFLDEFNTSSVLGLCKEIIVDHTLAGRPLEDNIVVVAACNPARKQATDTNSRERDLAREWAGGHYQVEELPPTVAKIKWSFGSLSHDQEKEFILRRLEMIDKEERSLPRYLRVALTEFISESQEAMRTFAARNIRVSLVRNRDGMSEEEIEAEVLARSRSVVSLRDIQRVFALFDFFSSDLKISILEDAPVAQTHRNAMLLAISTVYYLRLDGQSREEFLAMSRALPGEQKKNRDLLDILNCAMDEVINETEIPHGVAITRGLKENVFMTFACTLSQTPLMIVGPPGCSKTLSVNIVADNCNGEDSSSPFYRDHARLALFHYQCSKQSTSKELLAVFDKATQRQQRVDSAKHRCFMLMDEAGLPEEEKESLKVLHYLLEGHMSAKAEIGFVAITNHVLDAAKTNRCVMLLREEPDEGDMLSIARGILFGNRDGGYGRASHVDLEGKLLKAKDFALNLCQSYASLLHNDALFSWFDTFFGLRDLIHFFIALRSRSTFEAMKMRVTVQDIIFAVERNFNGVAPRDVQRIAECFLKPLICSEIKWSTSLLDGAFRDPVHVIREALQGSTGVSSLSDKARFKLIIDCSGDDSILRLLSMSRIIDVSKGCMFKVSRMPEEVSLEELKVVAGVKYAALQGSAAVLSQTESINESFYDLFNQRFQAVTGRDGSVGLYANIAVGGISRRSLIHPDFECIVHVNESELARMPAPFLNRFEKYRLTIDDVLHSGWDSLGEHAIVFQRSRQSLFKLASILCSNESTGWVSDKKSLDSLFVSLLPTTSPSTEVEAPTMVGKGLPEHAYGESGILNSLQASTRDIEFVVESAIKYLHVKYAETLQLAFAKSNQKLTIQELFYLLRDNGGGATQAGQIVQTLAKMLTTRVTTRRLLQLATPESVFAARDCIPEILLHDYFAQEHFSLKALIGNLVSTAKLNGETSLSIVYTRTEASIHGIPTHNANRNLALDDPSAADRLRRLIHGDLEELVVENLSVLKSEAMLSSAVESWAKDSSKRIFVLLADMKEAYAFEKVTFARMRMEQNVDGASGSGKAYVLLMHYPLSGRDGRHLYPALFLGGWEHYYLDGIGSPEQSLGIEDLIEAACRSGSDGDLADMEYVKNRISYSCLCLLPRVIPHVACLKLLYPNQVPQGRTPFNARSLILRKVLSAKVGTQGVGAILCNKFSAIWAEHGLMSSMRKSTAGLLRGTTRLPLAVAMHTALVETFDTFLTAMLVEMNRWRNLDLLLDPSADDRTCELFGLILKDIPVVPFAELVLQTKSNVAQVPPFADPRHETAVVRFPFFQLISNFIDNCIESVERTFVEERLKDAEISFVHPRGRDLVPKTLELIHSIGQSEPSPDVQSMAARAKSVLTAISFVEAESGPLERSLFSQYLCHYVEWRWGHDTRPFAVDRVMKEISGYATDRNIVAIHVAARARSRDISALASFHKHFAALNVSPKDSEEAFAVESLTGEDLFERLLDHFEKTIFVDGVRNSQWITSFSSFVRQIPAMLGGKGVEDIRTACSLRILSVLSISIEAAASTDAQQVAANVWKDRDSMSNDELVAALSIENVLLVDHGQSDESNARVCEIALRHFFSPTWMSATRVFRRADITSFITEINCGVLDKVDNQVLVALILRSCFHNVKEMPTLSELLTSSNLVEIGSRLPCEQVSSFSHDGKRTCVPHFVSNWLQRDGTEATQQHCSSTDFGIFFESYVQCFNSRTASVVFMTLLQIHIGEAETMSSENLFIGLVRAIHEETSLQRLEQTRLSRSRKVSHAESVTGTPLGAMALDVQLICFVAKLAYEISIDGRIAVLDGVYASEVSSLLEELMSLNHMKWQEFFIGNVLRISGEGTLVSALGHNGQLGQMEWSQEWIRGLPLHLDEAARRLRDAEHSLAEAMEEEERKSREFRLCPRCSQPFSVLAVNCGTFVCGRDYHGQRQAAFGCGQQFQINTAPYYVPDEALLASLRVTLASEQARFRDHENAGSRWDDARNIQLPIASFKIERDSLKRSLLPNSSFAHVEADMDVDSKLVSLVEVLREGSKQAPHFLLLPDLIEFYAWLHTTFRYLVTKEQAYRLKLSEIVKLALLQTRFDTVSACHISDLWQRVVSGVNEYLDHVNHSIAWECEEIRVGFEKLENASLVALLSEEDHPTEGNDVLFLIVNAIVGGYNSFVRRLVECVDDDGSGSLHLEEVHPASIATGCGGAVAMSSVIPLSSLNLNVIVSSYWISEEEGYDREGLRTALRRELGLQRSLPVFSNPSNTLREQFQFRDDTSVPLADVGVHLSVFVSEEGDYFANHQDYNLVNDIRKSLLALDMCVGDNEIRRSLSDNFFCFDYSQLRLLLEGCRSLLASATMEFIEFDSVDQVLRQTASCQSTFSAIEALHSYGFPEMSPSQLQLLMMMDAAQFVELVKFFSYQLASESYLFASLPLCMTDPLKDVDKQKITLRIGQIGEERGAKATVDCMEEFSRDVLSFYETQIRDATSSNRSLKLFLLEENYCDDSDPVFAILPSSISILNYVSLRQHLQQVKLALLSREPLMTADVANRNVDKDTVELFTRPSRGRCWLWEDDEMEDQEFVDEGEYVSSVPYNENWRLWFEVHQSDEEGEDMSIVHETKPTDSYQGSTVAEDAIMDDVTSDVSGAQNVMMDIDECPDDEDITEEERLQTRSARILQHWWRQQRSQLDRRDDYLAYDAYEAMFLDIDDDDDEEEEEEEETIFDSRTEQYTKAMAYQGTPTIQEQYSVSQSDGLNTHHEHSSAERQVQTLRTLLSDGSGGIPVLSSESNLECPAVATKQPIPSGQPPSGGQLESRSIKAGKARPESNLAEDSQLWLDSPSMTSGKRISARESQHSNIAVESFQYGSVQEEQAMRKWIDESRLQQSVADELLKLGARNIEDVVDLVESSPELLEDMNIKPFDRTKLKNAVKVMQGST